VAAGKCGDYGENCLNVVFNLQNAAADESSVYYLPCVTSDSLHRKSSYRCPRSTINFDTTFLWVSFTCPSYVCAALTCIYSYQGGRCDRQGQTCAISSVIDQPNCPSDPQFCGGDDVSLSWTLSSSSITKIWHLGCISRDCVLRSLVSGQALEGGLASHV
jgi:hypothetical protein